jgi:hypothetical protein
MSKVDFVINNLINFIEEHFIDVKYEQEHGFCATLLPYSKLRPLQIEKIRYYGITGYVTNEPNFEGKISYPYTILCKFEKVLEDEKNEG